LLQLEDRGGPARGGDARGSTATFPDWNIVLAAGSAGTAEGASRTFNDHR
jgi:hypothetical protein